MLHIRDMNNETSSKYPNVSVQLSGQDGNAFAILAACRKAARRAKVPQISQEEIELFTAEAMSGDYNHLLATCMAWFDVS
jgi:hypothetical protein